jgi:carboxyl-terminal processing protease
MKSFNIAIPKYIPKLIFKPRCSFGVALIAAACLAACGGSGDDAGVGNSATCSVADQNVWLRDYMQGYYYWAGLAPNPDPKSYTSIKSYFEAQFYPGSGVVPKDRWSYIEDTAAYNQFFVEGKNLGYGFFVNGLEKQLPMKVRYVEPQSPAGSVLKRGDVIVSLNGRSAADLSAAQDFSALNPAKEGEVLTAVIDSGAGPKTVTLSATNYSLTPVSADAVLTLPSGAKAGYVVLKDFIAQADAPLAAAIANIRAAGATDLILDLRYNGGGRIATATALASLIAGASNNGKVFTQLIHNDLKISLNSVFNLSGGNGFAFKRVVVLTGARTCSASELVVNGLKPYTNVSTVGGTSCGKPFGFSPVNNCGSTYSAVNFESFNAQSQGRYYDGIPASCPVADDFSGALGSPTEKLTSAALNYLQTGTCPAAAAEQRIQAAAVHQRAVTTLESGERRGMWVD